MRSARRPPSSFERFLVMVLVGFIAVDLLLIVPAYASELRLDRLHPSLPIVNLRPLAAARARITDGLGEEFTAPVRKIAGDLQQAGAKALNVAFPSPTVDSFETSVIQTATALALPLSTQSPAATLALIPSYTPTSTAALSQQDPSMTPSQVAAITATIVCTALPVTACQTPTAIATSTPSPTITQTALPIPTNVGPVRAFPGAEGFGAGSVGGRGGRVIEVINLDDSGPGSLRAAVEAEGPRIVVFRVGGTITLQSSLNITNPFITIAGQTAPGGGIALKSSPSYDKATLAIQTHDVIIRYLRVRSGKSTEVSSNRDALVIAHISTAVYNVIIDHCSISWATDENISTWYDSHDITIQWCIISEALRDSTHTKGPHSMGMLLGSAGSRNISVHHNLFAHNNARNPRIKTSGMVDIVNNVIYNPHFENYGDWGPSHTTDDYAIVQVNYIANYYKAGAESGTANYYISGSNSSGGLGQAELYVQGNITPLRHSDSADELTGVVRPAQYSWVVPSRHPAPTVTTSSAFDAYEAVLANAGATLPMRDEVDERIVNDVMNGTGQIIDDPSEVGGWPELPTGTAPLDTDHDGMPNEWENLYCFDPNDPSDGPKDADGDGYTNVEEFLNGTQPIAGGPC